MDDEMHVGLLEAPREKGDDDIDDDDLRTRVWDESKKIWRVALPGIISRASSFGTIVVMHSFVGHVSDLDLAAYALVQTISARFVNGVLNGMASATETLACGQTFGAGHDHIIYLQRSWIVDLVSLTILLPIFISGSQIYKLLCEDENIATRGEYISLWFIPFVYSYVFSLTIQMYLQAQLKNIHMIAWLSIAQFAIHVLLSCFFVYELNLGTPGALAALCTSSWFMVIGEFVYIVGGWCPYSWKGFTIVAFKDVFPVVKLSISSGVMVCLELWYYAVLVLIAGNMENAEVEISAFSICLNIYGWEFMISLGFLAAACVRVGNELGKGNAKAAKFSIKVLLATSIATGVFIATLCLAFGHKLAYIYTSNAQVAEIVSDLSVLVSISVFLNSIYPVLSGVAVGAGMQGTVAVVNFCCFYLIGIPLGVVLGYVAHLEVKTTRSCIRDCVMESLRTALLEFGIDPCHCI